MTKNEVRVATVQMELRAAQPDAFLARLHDYARKVASAGADFIVFPEWFSLQMLAASAPRAPHDAMAWLSDQTGLLVDGLAAIARAETINIIGGSHPVRTGERLHNVCPVVLRDGATHLVSKLHPTPDEASVWGISGGDAMSAIATDCGPVGVAICYDSEFPEPVRRIADQGGMILFVPYFTETRHGHLRVRYCCQARAVENQSYVVTSGLFGSIDGIANADAGYAQSAILTPCDTVFADNGIAAQGDVNHDEIILASLDLGKLAWAREHGQVRNMANRRTDLYSVAWSGAD
jgi:predicted amidohydrolase